MKIVLDENTLTCPKCNSINLHQGRVNVFNRYKEDDPYGLHIEVCSTGFEAVSDMIGNPSDRRNGLTINFWCENCDDVSNLQIYQHKGETILEWKNE